MSITRQTILASRPAAMILALSLVAGLAAPFVMLPRVQAQTASLPCAEVNHNGCTELSSSPPEDTVSVPPNIVLMLDDSGSMDWDFMPDWDYLGSGHPSGWNSSIKSPGNETVANPGVRNSAVNDVYYNPTTVYTPPPNADGTLFQDSPGLTGAYKDGFLDTTHYQNVTTYTGGGDGHSYAYYTNLIVGYTDYGAPTVNCPSGYSPDPSDSTQCIRPPVSPSTTYTCNSGDGSPRNYNGQPNWCRHRVFTESGPVDTWYPATPRYGCPSGTTLGSDNLCHYPIKPATLSCTSGSLRNGTCQSAQTKPFFTYVTGTTPATYVAHFVGAGSNCDLLYNTDDKAVCVNEDDTSGMSAPSTYTDADGTIKNYLAQDGTNLTAGQNIANWYSYYRTRMLMAKSSLMKAFIKLGPKYRFGFASINANGIANIPSTPTPYGFSDAGGGGGASSNLLAVVQPFGDGSSGTQKALFWNWLKNESANSGTPLRKALQAVGQYYQTAQPWSTMSSDPGYTSGSTTKFACRASFTILTTDGFWNGGDPTTPSDLVGAADKDGPVQSVPSNDLTQYTKVDPFQGGGAVGGSGGSTTVASLADVATYYWENDLQPSADMPNEVKPTAKDPAAWQHMTTYTVGLGFAPLYADQTTPIPMNDVFTWAHNVDFNKPVGATPSGFSWPTPSSNSLNNIADLAHAAVNGRGNFFSAKSPDELAADFGDIFNDVGKSTVAPTSAAVNASVLSLGAVSFSTGYSTADWSGALEAVTLKPDGTVDQVVWMSGSDPNNHLPSASVPSILDTAYHNSDSSTGYGSRKVWTDAYDPTATPAFNAFQFTTANKAKLGSAEIAGLGGNTDCTTTSTSDTICNRIAYLLGDNTYEGTTYRVRSTILGAILRAAPVYVAYPSGNYYNSWPSGSPEIASGAESYDTFVSDHANRPGSVYVGANDGMLHAFNAPVPTCSSFDPGTGVCSSGWVAGTDAGKENWAFIPRAVYANLGNLTVKDNFQFRRTVDATPVTRDVFFGSKWHTILAGGVGLGGRGVYALDITDPTTPFSASNVLWEFDPDMTGETSDCKTNYGACKASDLGFTVSQPNIGRVALKNPTTGDNGTWVVLVPNGYFPDCTTPDMPTADQASCEAIAAQAPKNTSDGSNKPYSALFVLDAQTGKVIAELKTPTGLGVTSFGLATPVMGDYQNDQVDDVAFAGDVQGNLWRFDLTSTDASDWTVTLVYKGNVDATTGVGLQPITTMPRLFPDPTTNRFMVLFGTGKYLGLGDNGSPSPVQAIYGVRDDGNTYSQTDLAPRYLHETTVTMPDGTTATARCVTGAAGDACDTTPSAAGVGAAGTGGWFINLKTTASNGTTVTDDGERVVVNPGAIFASNTVVFETLITGTQSTDPCNPATQGGILVLNAVTGGSAGASSLGGGNYAGGRINNARTSGSLPLVSALGGGRAYLPGMTLAPGKNPISIDAPIWRRRSWQGIQQN